MSESDEVAKLVGTVRQLPRADQYKILRLVKLMTQAPLRAQQRTQAQLREILACAPKSRAQCLDAIDSLIAELEVSVLPGDHRLRDTDGKIGLRIYPDGQS